MVDFKELRLPGATAGRLRSEFLGSVLGKPRALLVYLHGRGERAEENAPQKNALWGNPRLIPNILASDGATARYVDEHFVVVVPQAFLAKSDWDAAGLWRGLKAFYGPHVGAELNGRLFITGVSMGGFGAWSLANEVLSHAAQFRLEAVAPVDVYKAIAPKPALSAVRALALRTTHIRHDATEQALAAVGQSANFIDRRHAPANCSEAWASLYGDVQFYRWLLEPGAALPGVP